MGCASSTPMIQTTGSEMLKAATHVATDATKTAEDAVEGIKDSVGKSLETAKDSVATTVESVKHEVENVVKEKSEMLEDATNSLMEKLHLKQTENEENKENTNTNKEIIDKTETDELKTQLNENSKHSHDDNHTAAGSHLKENDIETDSLKTSTPEPEIEQALAKRHNSQEDDDDNPPTPKPTLAELENLTAEILKQEQQNDGMAMVNDITMTNDPLMSVMHENIRTLDGNNMMSLAAENNTIKDHEPPATTTLTNNDNKSTNVHSAATDQTSHSQNLQSSMMPLTLATTAIVTATATGTVSSKVVKEKGKLKKSSVHKKEDKAAKKNNNKYEEKRPRTTEWEKFADMLTQIRKFNPHDVYRRGGTLMKFGGGGTGQLKERYVLGHHMRSGIYDDDGSDTTVPASPQCSQRSSARAMGRVQRSSNRPNTGNNRRSKGETSTNNGNGGHYVYKTRRNSNFTATTGRKFDFNPTRARVNDFVSSTSLIPSYLQNTLPTQMPYAPYSHSYESVKSPAKMRPHHSRSEMINLPPLEALERTRSHSRQEPMTQNNLHKHYQQHLKHANAQFAFDHNGSSMPMQNDLHNYDTSTLTRESSNTSLSSRNSCTENVPNFRSSNSDVRLQPTNNPPVKNTSSFLTTPRTSPFSLKKSYTDLFFSSTSNKENKPIASSGKSAPKVRQTCNVCPKKR